MGLAEILEKSLDIDGILNLAAGAKDLENPVEKKQE